MLFTKQPVPGRAFYGVALFLILIGAGIVAVGLVEEFGMLLWNWQFGWPAAKTVAGLVVLALGYIILELELIRSKP
jgi:hypothetical protein